MISQSASREESRFGIPAVPAADAIQAYWILFGEGGSGDCKSEDGQHAWHLKAFCSVKNRVEKVAGVYRQKWESRDHSKQVLKHDFVLVQIDDIIGLGGRSPVRSQAT